MTKKNKRKKNDRTKFVDGKSYEISLKFGKRNMCLKLSIANNGRSLIDLPRCCNGWRNWAPSACKQFTPAKQNEKQWEFKRENEFTSFILKLFGHFSFEKCDRLVIIGFVKQNQKRQTFVGQFFGIGKCDFSNQRNTFLFRPTCQRFQFS